MNFNNDKNLTRRQQAKQPANQPAKQMTSNTTTTTTSTNISSTDLKYLVGAVDQNAVKLMDSLNTLRAFSDQSDDLKYAIGAVDEIAAKLMDDLNTLKKATMPEVKELKKLDIFEYFSAMYDSNPNYFDKYIRMIDIGRLITAVIKTDLVDAAYKPAELHRIRKARYYQYMTQNGYKSILERLTAEYNDKLAKTANRKKFPTKKEVFLKMWENSPDVIKKQAVLAVPDSDVENYYKYFKLVNPEQLEEWWADYVAENSATN